MIAIVFCREPADDHSLEWKGELPGVSYEVEAHPDDDLLRHVRFEPAMVVRVTGARDARMEAFALAEWVAESFRGAIFLEDTGEVTDVGEREARTLAGLVERWRTTFAPQIEQARAKARSKAQARETSYARAQAGERVEFFDWSMDFEDDGEDARAAERVAKRIAQRRAQAAASIPVDDPSDLRELTRLLTPTLLETLERAVRAAMWRSHAELTVPHWLLSVLAADEGDAPIVCAASGADRDMLGRHFATRLEGRPRGATKPVFSPEMGPLIRSAWGLVDVDGGETRIRSGWLLWAALRPPPQGQAMEWWRFGLGELLSPTAATRDVRRALAAADRAEVREARQPRGG